MQQDIVLFSKNGHVVLVLAQGLDGLRDLNGHSTAVAENYLRNTCLWETTTTCAPEYLKDVEDPEFSQHTKTFLRTVKRKVVIVYPTTGKEQNLQCLKNFLEVYGKKIVLVEKTDYIEVTCPSNFVDGIIPLVEKYGYEATEIQEAPELTAEDVMIPKMEKPAERKKVYALDKLFDAVYWMMTSEDAFFIAIRWVFRVLAPAFGTACVFLVISLVLAIIAEDFTLWWVLPSVGLVFGLIVCQIIWADRTKQDKKPANPAC